MNLYDAHNHLHDERLAPFRSEVLLRLEELPIARSVVNGTQESDWPAVASLAGEKPWVHPSFGLHPWYVQNRSSRWKETLEALLLQFPNAGVGEVGLDRWIENFDIETQTEVFSFQLALAAKHDRPLSIHCLKAWGALWELLRETPLPTRGFLLHSYGGPAEMVHGFVERGGFFSFSPYFLHTRKAKQRELFAALPLDRLLVETDAPDLAPPPERNPNPLQTTADAPLNHPLNIQLAHEAIAAIRGIPLADLAEAVESNFHRLFG